MQQTGAARAAPVRLSWFTAAPPAARRALIAASLGWMLDSFDVMLYALVLAALMLDLGIDKTTAGVLGSITLLAAAAGGLIFGAIADRFGRTRAMMASILIYAVFTAACGFAQNAVQLAIFRILLGLGMGGEWASGASLVSETWPAEHRGKALGLMQSSWAIGYALAAIVTAVVMPIGGWRAVFFVGILPALVTIWIRRFVEESPLWTQAARARGSVFSSFRELFTGTPIGITAAITLMNSCTLFAWWGFNLWVPAFLSLPQAEGGVGLEPRIMSAFIVAMQIGMWFGYITFGYVSDKVGRRRSYVFYLLVAAAVMMLYSTTRSPLLLLALGPVLAFFGTGYYTGFGAVTAEIYPTRVRATAQGFTYNIGRIASAAAPFTVGSLAQTAGFSTAFTILSLAFLLASVFWFWIPETKGRSLF